jgi:hypothetical protein
VTIPGEILKPIIETWLAQRDAGNGITGHPMSACEALAELSDVNERTIRAILRDGRGARFTTADKLLSGMDMNEAWGCDPALARFIDA